MLYKKELKEIPPSEFNLKLTKAGKEYQFVAAAKVVQTKRSGNILIVDYYDTIKKELQARFFANVAEKNYISYDPDADKWFTGSIARFLLGLLFGQSTLSILDHPGTQKTVSNYLDLFENNFNPMYYYSEFGRDIPRVKGATGTIELWMNEKRKDNNRKAFDRRMDQNRFFHSLFEKKYAFARKAERYFLEHFNSNPELTYIFFKKLDDKGRRYGICSHCGKRIRLPRQRPRKGDKTHCSRCGAEGSLVDLRYAPNVSNKETVAVANRIDGYVTFEVLNCYRSFTDTGKPIISYDDLYRTVYDIKKQVVKSSSGQRFYWSWTHYTKWAPGSHDFVMYPDNLNEVMGDLVPYLDMAQISRDNGKKINIIQMFLNCTKYPCTEYLYKMGFHKLVDDEYLPRKVDVNGKTAAAVLAVRPEQVKWMSKADIDMNELGFIREVQCPLTSEMFDYCRQNKLSKSAATINTLLKYMSFQKLVSYLEAQKYHMRFSPYVVANLVYETLICFRDYAGMSEELGIHLNRKNLFPSNVVIAHDKLRDRINEIKYAKADEKSREGLSLVGERFKRFEKDGFCIIVPHVRSDFIREGQELSHCVGAQHYYDNHIKGKSLIFFIREIEHPEIAKYTAEIDMESYHVVQCYGYGDSQPPKEVKDFINGFAKYLKSHPKKEIDYAEDLRTKKAS